MTFQKLVMFVVDWRVRGHRAGQGPGWGSAEPAAREGAALPARRALPAPRVLLARRCPTLASPRRRNGAS